MPEVLEKVKRGGETRIEKLEKEIKACENIIKAQREQINRKIEEAKDDNKSDVKHKFEERIEGMEQKME